jgi:6-pyruvoyltetrahydropterin/6-carboxytetrahydropterin synthase
MEIFKEFYIESAHALLSLPKEHMYRRLHGHSFKIKIYVSGEINDNGWIMDFGDIKEAFKPIYDELNYRYLNDVVHPDHPTNEIIACWIWDRLKPKLSALSKIEIQETCSPACTYVGQTHNK